MKWLDHFNLTNTQRKGYLALLSILFIVLVARIGMIFWPSANIEKNSTLQQELLEFEKYRIQRLKVENAFNPNTVTDSVIESFYLPDYTKRNWIKFRESRRVFKKRLDVLAIYGMDTAWYEINQDSILIDDISTKDKPENEQIEYFDFDPNTANKAELESLGFPSWLAQRIINYRNGGGYFNKPNDLLRIYDFPEDLYNKIEPFVQIKLEVQATEEEVKEVVVKVIELNTADSTALLTVKGIGPVFAHRILEYREKLGGYFNKNQLLEVYGIDDVKLNDITEQLTVNARSIVKLKINEASFKQLLAHPYLDFEQVKAIVNYRESIGLHKRVSDLKNLPGFKDADIERLLPYLSVE